MRRELQCQASPHTQVVQLWLGDAACATLGVWLWAGVLVGLPREAWRGCGGLVAAAGEGRSRGIGWGLCPLLEHGEPTFRQVTHSCCRQWDLCQSRADRAVGTVSCSPVVPELLFTVLPLRRLAGLCWQQSSSLR